MARKAAILDLRDQIINVSNQRKGERPPLQRPIVLAICNIRIPLWSTGSIEQPKSCFPA